MNSDPSMLVAVGGGGGGGASDFIRVGYWGDNPVSRRLATSCDPFEGSATDCVYSIDHLKPHTLTPNP